MLLICVTVLIAMGKDPGALISVGASVLIPSLLSLITLGHLSDVKRDVGVVRTQTNGHLTALAAAAGIPHLSPTQLPTNGGLPPTPTPGAEAPTP